jgi:uncharacterized protein YdaU (DUF1376 family)
VVSLAYFPLYVDRYEGDTVHLSMLEDGAYNRLLRLCWRSPGCKFPNDQDWIMRKVRAVSAEEKAAVQNVLSEFFTVGRGKVWSKKLLEVHNTVAVTHERKSEAGKKGASAKALKSKETSSGSAKAKLKPTFSNKEPNIEPKEEDSVANATDGDAVAAGSEPDFSKAIFDRGVKFLIGHGTPERQARSVIGKWRQTATDGEIFEAFVEAKRSEVVEPVAWITARLKPPEAVDVKALMAKINPDGTLKNGIPTA